MGYSDLVLESSTLINKVKLQMEEFDSQTAERTGLGNAKWRGELAGMGSEFGELMNTNRKVKRS